MSLVTLKLKQILNERSYFATRYCNCQLLFTRQHVFFFFFFFFCEIVIVRILPYLQLTIYEPQYDKTSKMVCAPSEDSGLIRVFAVRLWVAMDPRFRHTDSEDSD